MIRQVRRPGIRCALAWRSTFLPRNDTGANRADTMDGVYTLARYANTKRQARFS